MIWTQIITAIMAIVLAWLNRWPILTFRRYGLSLQGEIEFHAANAVAKIAFCAAMAKMADAGLKTSLLLFVLLMLIQWLCFDIALNLFTGKPAFYLGKTAWLDRLVKNGFIKAIACLVLIVILNLVL